MEATGVGIVPALRVAIIDDDVSTLTALARLVGTVGCDVATFSSADAFKESFEDFHADVLLVDVLLPGTDGIALLEALVEHGRRLPAVVLSGHVSVQSSVRAIRAGAVDVLEKPCDRDTIAGALDRAFEVARSNREIAATRDRLQPRWRSLTPREREVCLRVIQGHLNKQIAVAIGTCEKTVKVHRGRVMTKMRAESVPDLVRQVDWLWNVSRGTGAISVERAPTTWDEWRAPALRCG